LPSPNNEKKKQCSTFYCPNNIRADCVVYGISNWPSQNSLVSKRTNMEYLLLEPDGTVLIKKNHEHGRVVDRCIWESLYCTHESNFKLQRGEITHWKHAMSNWLCLIYVMTTKKETISVDREHLHFGDWRCWGECRIKLIMRPPLLPLVVHVFSAFWTSSKVLSMLFDFWQSNSSRE